MFFSIVFRSLVIVVALFVTMNSAYAKDKLTVHDIEAFYEEAAAVQMLGAEATIDFLDRHMHDNSYTVLHIVTNMSGMPSQKQTMEYDKARLLRETEQGYKMGQTESVENTVLSVEIMPDGRTAKVKDTSYSIVTMTMPTPAGMMQVKSEQSMLCDDVVVLNRGVIQGKKSVCNAEVTMTPMF